MKNHKRKSEWFDNEELWRETFPFMFPEERIASADATVKKALSLCKVKGKSALDLCCGPGRCSFHYPGLVSPSQESIEPNTSSTKRVRELGPPKSALSGSMRTCGIS
jgi:hypothetical protein